MLNIHSLSLVLCLPLLVDGGGGGWTPPLHGSGSTGAGSSTGAGNPTSGGPSTPAPASPVPPGPRGGGRSGGPPAEGTPAPANGPATGGPASNGSGPATGGTLPKVPGASQGGPSTGGGLAAMLEPTWDVWWLLHREEFLELKQSVGAGLETPAGLEPDDDLARLLANRSLRPSAQEIHTQVVPALQQLLASEHGNDVVAGAELALARIGEVPGAEAGARSAPRLARLIADPNQEIGERAALALGVLGDEASVPLLGSLVLDEPDGRVAAGARSVPLRVRSFAAYGLGLIGRRTHNNRVRQLVARTLCAAIAAREGVAADTQAASVIALGLTPLDPEPLPSQSAPWISRQTQIAFLLDLARDREARTLLRAHALDALALLQRGAGPELRQAVADCALDALRRGRSEGLVRECALIALGTLGDDDEDDLDRELRTELLRALAGGSTAERCFALMALSEVAARPGREASCQATVAAVRTRLLEELAQGNGRMRSWSALALGVLEFRLQRRGASTPPAVGAALRRVFEEAAGPEEQTACAIALGLCRDEAAGAVLLARLEKATDEVPRAYVALSLGLLHDTRHAPALRALVGRSAFRPFLLQQTAIALTLLGEKAHVQELLAELETAQGTASQGWLAQALGFVGDASSVPGLLGLARDVHRNPRSRGYVELALGIVCDKDDVSWNYPIGSSFNWRAVTSTLLSGDGTGVLEIL